MSTRFNGGSFVFNPLLLNELNQTDSDTGRLLLRAGNNVRNEVVILLTNRMVNIQSNRLRSSITAQLTQLEGDLVCVIGSDVEYAPHVHERGRPFLTTGLESGIRRLG